MEDYTLPAEVTVVGLPEPVEVTVVDLPEPLAVTVVDHRPFFSTPLDDYTVTEGLLLLIFMILFINWLGRALKEGFAWLKS